jgi:hypothetical protein
LDTRTHEITAQRQQSIDQWRGKVLLDNLENLSFRLHRPDSKPIHDLLVKRRHLSPSTLCRSNSGKLRDAGKSPRAVSHQINNDSRR